MGIQFSAPDTPFPRCPSLSHQQPRPNRSPYKAHRQTSIPPQNFVPPKNKPKQPSHSASTSESAAYLLPTLFFEQQSRELIKYLTKRGYGRTSLQRDANRVLSIPRRATRQPQEKKSAKTDRTPFVTSLNPALPKISSVSPQFNQAGHSINDVRHIPIELMRREAGEAHLINKAKTTSARHKQKR